MTIKLYSVMWLLTIFSLLFSSNSFAQAVLSDPSVELIYFRPYDRPIRRDRVSALQQLIKDTQTFYADEMERHGFGRKTFTIQTDRKGNPLVNHVKGRLNDASYHKQTINKVWPELRNTYNNPQRIYFVVIDISSESLDRRCGGAKGYSEQHTRGFLIPASGHCFKLSLAAHELGHALGLEHDFRDNSYIMSYGSNPKSLSKCAAEWLDSHGFFNNTSAQINEDVRIQMLAPTAATPNGIRLRFEVNAVERLHQAMLYLKPTLADPAQDYKLDGCLLLDAESETIEFVTSELVDASQDEVTLQVIGKHGGMKRQTFPIKFAHLLPPPKEISISDRNLAAAVREALGLGKNDRILQRAMQTLSKLDARNSNIKNLAGLEHATELRRLELRDNQIRNIRPLANLKKLETLVLDNNRVGDITPLANMTQLTWLLIGGSNPISDFTPLSNLKRLEGLSIWGQNIKEISFLVNMTTLTNLWVGRNKINDISPLENLTQLKFLYLENNHIKDVAPLVGLTNLQTLNLQGNQIQDVSPLAKLTKLAELRLADNPIQDASVLASLKKLTDVDIKIPQASPVVVRIPAAQRPPMYWVNTQTGTVHRLVGAKMENLLPSIKNATNLAVDTANGKLYWTTKINNRRGRIQRANLDGSNVQLIKNLTSVPQGIALDTANGKIYLTNSWGKLQRLNLDGSNFQPNLVTGLKSPNHLALDIERGKAYWTEKTSRKTGKIRRANLDGTNVELVKNLTGVPRGLAVNSVNGKIYLTNSWGKVQRLNLNGSNFQPNLIIGLKSLGEVTVDVAKAKLYWAQKGRIRRADLNGENSQDIVTGLGGSVRVALGASSAHTSIATAPAITAVPEQTLLLSNYPNPFNPETWIPYQLSEPADVTVSIHSVDSRLVRTLELGQLPAGVYEGKTRAAYWDGRNAQGESVASGVYFYTLTAGKFTATRKMLIRK